MDLGLARPAGGPGCAAARCSLGPAQKSEAFLRGLALRATAYHP
ncbi:hypothetical protein SGRA_4005 [Saprospira grandis str. Lewin]|uniref:Uncharacterized protein n=1 Tax=Saprospira grandis (strain Lewin) TaxID=984262 RepID=H6L8J5_SAPGL|nr:hypothetical protein SGRA_4005 [Saprospira grandis str. Lewin]